MEKALENFTKYERARILGARALQISMDAPVLLKMSEEELESLNFDSLKIAQKELDEGVLPISIHRPLPKKRESKLKALKVNSDINEGSESTELDSDDGLVQELVEEFESEEDTSISEEE